MKNRGNKPFLVRVFRGLSYLDRGNLPTLDTTFDLDTCAPSKASAKIRFRNYYDWRAKCSADSTFDRMLRKTFVMNRTFTRFTFWLPNPGYSGLAAKALLSNPICWF